MDVKELRIGNLVEILGEERVVETISNMPSRGEMYWVGTKGLMDVKMIHVKPIKITEEWLLEKGFEEEEYAGGCYSLEGISIDTSDFQCAVNGKWIDPNITYKHQLQNLYLTLKGKELI